MATQTRATRKSRKEPAGEAGVRPASNASCGSEARSSRPAARAKELGRLPDRARLLVALQDLEGLSAEQIAIVLSDRTADIAREIAAAREALSAGRAAVEGHEDEGHKEEGREDEERKEANR